MKQIYLFERQLIGRHCHTFCEIVDVADERAQNIIENGKGELFTGDTDFHFKNLMVRNGHNDSDIDDAFELAMKHERDRESYKESVRQLQEQEYETADIPKQEEYEKAVKPKPKRRRNKKSEA